MASEPSLPDFIRQTAEGVTLNLHLQPRASRCELCGVQGGALRVRITSPPVDDAANRQLAEFIAKILGIAKSKVSIIAGAKSRHKTILIEDVDIAAVKPLFLMNRLDKAGSK